MNTIKSFLNKLKKHLIQLVFGLSLLSIIPIEGHVSETKKVPLRQAEYGELVAFPEINEYVAKIGDKLVRSSDYPDMPMHFVILNTSIPNAWAFRSGTIAITRGLLLKMENESQLAAVLAHEIGHEVAYMRQKEREGHAFQEPTSTPVSIFETFDMVLMILNRKVMRQEEYDADFDGIRFMSKAGYNVNASIRVQEILENLMGPPEEDEGEKDWLFTLFHTHPSPQERKAVNLKTISSMPEGGIEGENEFRSSMRRLKEAEYTYRLIEQAREALQQNKPEEALKIAKNAANRLSTEPQAHSVMADALMAIHREKEALAALDRAIKCDATIYSLHLNKGLILDRIGYQTEARQELNHSLSLFPTAQAHFKLGLMDLRENQQESAIEHFYAASKFDSAFGEKAKAELEKIKL